jgi:Mg-chelatase subunit ChlD
MKFAHTWLLIATPFLTVLLWLLLRWGDRRRTRLREQFAGGGVKTWAKPAANTAVQRLNLTLILGAFALLLLTLARPLYFERDEQSELQGVPYLIALDSSRSMLTMDVKPSRWNVATNAIDRFLADTKADRIGLLTFSQVAFLNAPLTFDTLALRTALELTTDRRNDIVHRADRAQSNLEAEAQQEIEYSQAFNGVTVIEKVCRALDELVKRQLAEINTRASETPT